LPSNLGNNKHILTNFCHKDNQTTLNVEITHHNYFYEKTYTEKLRLIITSAYPR